MSESSEEYQNDFFEGTEKLLEVWFGHRSSCECHKKCDLRIIPRTTWETMLKLVKCEIISQLSNDEIDSYVLSESSMFVSRDRFILKTCGTTTLLRCVNALLYIITQYTGFDKVRDVFYSRKNYMRPELQDKPHSSFEKEAALLDSIFKEGNAYCLGSINRDCWYLYTLQGNHMNRADQTLELIMQELDPKVMSIFTQAESNSALEATRKSGIDTIYPGAKIDDFLFSPCGYSMNGLIKNDYYITIHITPEPQCSYVSFETNFPHEKYEQVISDVIRIFRPGKCVATLFASKESVASRVVRHFDELAIVGYQQKELQMCRFKEYDLTFALFAKAPS
ncbi:S-adenosylmethionine decarboxylase proenzyme isoform 2 [Tropilaelaps mercedesae]|uniref:S-adenosylmethionine decarboxylase proenzyme n=1 Tax=Tropilaelaps mercedesae TaxID=418985 RepID=A0A1V9XI98_9ACAR|nr:S-adenosylmethionine decarboxylase proenzyme isoform 2 [Tropilaelaps mercedesae]